jgi:hypothetical protein
MGILVAYLLGILAATKAKYQNRAEDDQTSNSSEYHSFPNRPISVMCIPPTLSDQDRAENKRKKRRKTVAFWVQIFSLVFLVIYAGVTVLIWFSTKTAAEAAKSAARTAHDELVKVNRPWVGIDGTPTLLQIKIGQSIEADILATVKNFGTAPALHVNMIAMVPAYLKGQIMSDVIKRADATMCALVENQSRPPKDERNFFDPLGPYIFPANSIQEKLSSRSGPGQGQIGTELSFDIIGCISYVDQFNEVVHHTHFCFMSGTSIAEVKPNQPLRPCPANEEAD